MPAFVVRRLARLLVVIVGVSLVTFAILHASGDPVALIMPEAPEADRAALRHALGLHDPLADASDHHFLGSILSSIFSKISLNQPKTVYIAFSISFAA